MNPDTNPNEVDSESLHGTPLDAQKAIQLGPSNHSGNIAIISFALFILIAVGTVAFFYYQNQQLKQMLANINSPSPIPADLSDPLASWAEYKNDTNGYQFKVPKEWNQLESDTTTPNKVVYQSGEGLYRFTLDIQDNVNESTGTPYKSLDEFVGLPYTVKAIAIDNQEARQPLPSSGMENFNKAYLFSPDGTRIFSLELLVGDGTMTDHRVSIESLRIGASIYDQILSTFKFTTTPLVEPEPIACTLDAMVCPDGSSVGRSGPNCEFVCPPMR